MRKLRSIASFADLLILVMVVALFPLSPFTPYQPFVAPHIADKLEIRYCKPVDPDSIQSALHYVEKEIEEMDYYLRVHNVTDDGYPLVARYNSRLQEEYRRLKYAANCTVQTAKPAERRYIPASKRPMIAVKTMGGHWKAGHFTMGPLKGHGIVRDYKGRIVSALFDADTVVTAIRIDSTGIYRGQMNAYYQACGQGVMDEWDGCHKDGFWYDDRMNGFGFDSSPDHQLRIGEWKMGNYLGEKMKYTAERIYGIDISRHQHEKGRRRYGIHWHQLRITSLGKRHPTDGRTFPVSFVYIKATEGTTIRNRYFAADYRNAHKHGIHVGAYHFFSLKSTAAAQATYFLRHSIIRGSDFPPVLDVEPSEAQIKKIGGDDELMRRIRIFLQQVEHHTGKRPILYVSQMFVNRHMRRATDIKQKYNIWIARYGQYRPDVRLVFWQLSPDGHVTGITGPVDINVFNGYQGQFEEFVRTGIHK